MSKTKKIFTDIILTIAILVGCFFACLAIDNLMHEQALVPAIFTLGVFVISLITSGYIYGIVSCLISVLAVNFAFTFPYFEFNFTIQENLISAIIMLIITIVSSALITKVRQNEKVRVETEKEKMRANLLRAISHDLRTPLTTIYGSSQAITEDMDKLTKEQIYMLADGIREDSQWLMGMVENLLTVTRIDNSKMKLIKREVVLWELIDSVLIRFRKRYPNQQVEVDIPEDFVSIPMDAMLIEQVIVNLLENAVQHAKGMDKLELHVFTMGNNAIFEIMDNGCGIAKEKMDNIFKGFFEKKESPIDNQKNSMGIGLSVCASIIKAHDGNISVENRKSGGACFRFSLTMEEAVNE